MSKKIAPAHSLGKENFSCILDSDLPSGAVVVEGKTIPFLFLLGVLGITVGDANIAIAPSNKTMGNPG